MVEHRDDLAARRRARWTQPRHGIEDEPARTGITSYASATARTARWADSFAAFLRAEIQDAERRGLISVSEGEQLLARLVVVVDQAVSPTG